MALMTLVRHGQASFGSDDYDQLSDLGVQQSRWLGEHFKQQSQQFDYIVTGTLKRHIQTTNGILETAPHEVPVHQDERINEFEFKQIVTAYLTLNPSQVPAKDAPRSDFYRLLRTAMLAWQEGDLDSQLNGETWAEFSTRVHSFITDLCASTHKNALVVSSGGAIALMLQHILQSPPHIAIELNLQIKNASYSQCFFGKGKANLALFNSTSYLETSDKRHAITYS